MRVSEVMTRDVCVARPDHTIEDVARMMLAIDAGLLPVGDDDHLVGMITDRDIVVRLVAKGKDPSNARVNEAMTREVRSVKEDSTVSEALDLMSRAHEACPYSRATRGNIDVTLLSRIIERGLVKDGRLVRLRVHLPDYPGALNRLTSILAEHRANIVETDYDRAYHGVGLGETAIEITMETRGPDHIAEIISALGAAGYAQERVL